MDIEKDTIEFNPVPNKIDPTVAVPSGSMPKEVKTVNPPNFFWFLEYLYNICIILLYEIMNQAYFFE